MSWSWELLVAHGEEEAPCPRDVWGGMLAHGGRLFLFGGATARYGPARAPGDLSTLGTLNDLWTYDPEHNRWTQLEGDDGSSGFSISAGRPCGRVLPAWVPVGGKFYLFGGLSVLGPGWRTCLLNDLWSYDPGTHRWELLEPHDGRALESPTSPRFHRPPTLAAMGAAGVGNRVYLMAGWGRTPQVIISSQLWRYDISSGTWEFLGPEGGEPWPSKRYCPAFVEYEGKLHLWGGRDTQEVPQRFYNDLWEYDIAGGRWRCLQGNRPDDPGVPSPRYGMGHARMGHYWYIFGGFGSYEGHSPQLNDLWCYDFRSGSWECLCPHDGSKDYTPSAVRPGVRRVPGMAALDDHVYLFGGLDLASGPRDEGPLIAFNDLWRGLPGGG